MSFSIFFLKPRQASFRSRKLREGSRCTADTPPFSPTRPVRLCLVIHLGTPPCAWVDSLLSHLGAHSTRALTSKPELPEPSNNYYISLRAAPPACVRRESPLGYNSYLWHCMSLVRSPQTPKESIIINFD